MRPRIEAVTVCVEYSDFLAETIKTNRGHFDRWLIVTRPDDLVTLDVCHRNNLEVITTNDFHRNGEAFNKGRAVERGLAMLSHDNWLLHIDADIALPGDFLESLEDADLDLACIYGADRLMIPNWDAWQEVKPKLNRSWHCYLSNHDLVVGARWADIRHGYVPVGFFQLWHQSADHRKGVRLRRYPDSHQNAARADVKFALQWDRRHRVLLPEVLVAHLESGPAVMGANWNGRKTKRFGPPCHGGGGKPVS